MKNKSIKSIGESCLSNSNVNNDMISQENQELDEPRRSKRRTIGKSFGPNFYTYLVEKKSKNILKSHDIYGLPLL